MAMVELVITPEAQEQFEQLPKVIRARILQITARLESWPQVSGVKPLRHGLAGRYRIRTGDYRVQFCVQGRRIVIEKIGKRDRFYEE